MSFNMLFDGAECLRGNIAHEEFSNDIVGDQRPDRRPAPHEVMHNADVHQGAICVQKPGYCHPSTDATHMSKIDAMLSRVKALASRPAHWKAVTMCRHLHQAFCRVS